MPASAKRAQRTRRDSRRDAAAANVQESSPTRPTKRRKKNDSTPTSTPSARRQQHQHAPPPPAEVAEDDESALTADQSGLGGNEGDQLVSRIAQHLVCPKDQLIQASKDHANSIHEASSDGVQAYAKIAALDWTFYITKLEVNIGRASDPPAGAAGAAGSVGGDKDDDVHIDLGPSKTISRQHAMIYFNSKDEQWSLDVKGRNGAKVDGELMKAGSARALRSGEVVEIGGVEMMFVLPAEISPLHIHETYLRRAGISPSQLLSSDPPRPAATVADASPSRPTRGAGAGAGVGVGDGAARQQPIAPAPPDYRRPGTPPSATRRRTTMVQARSPYPASTPTPFGAPLEIDLSKDENHHIKPQYSYAQMITQAIMQTEDEKLNLNGIYNFILENYSYYRHQEVAGWQNSIRHNLSLNKAFEKVARSTDEPGKGMKWQIVAEHRDEMLRNAYKGGRGGHRGSSAPSSPSQLNYITHGPRDMIARDPASISASTSASTSTSTRKRKTSPRAASPPPAQSTPERSRGRLDASRAAMTSDGSPLPRPRRPVPNAAPAPVAASSAGQSQPQSPTLVSSFLQDENAPFVTPAPPRVHPRLAPPSTAPRPSQHMPTSSPAPFWKYADIGSTPLKPPAQFDASPSRRPAMPPSSSPPPRPAKSPASSPQQPSNVEAAAADSAPEVDEDQGFDLAKGFQSIGSYHAPVSQGVSIAPARDHR